MINELRLGNFVWGVSDRREVVYAIEEHTVTVGHPFKAYVGNTNTRCYADEIKPIELTPELLGKCGFTERDEIWDHNLFDMWLYPTRRGWFISPHMPDGGVPIKFLHQLQNLYFCLTGKELIVEL